MILMRINAAPGQADTPPAPVPFRAARAKGSSHAAPHRPDARGHRGPPPADPRHLHPDTPLAVAPGATVTLALETIAPTAGAEERATLRLSVPGIQSGEGSVIVQVYGTADGFRDPARAITQASVPARPGTLEIVLDGLPPGRRAVILYHDENGNRTLDRFLGMIPTEGYGVSNDPTLSGPPSFDEAACALPPGETRMQITVGY